ncbi:hypothetical protein DNU06_00065 [Putridiphycobacter roseus]|uniref:Uncharacterized protein n=1 Tax=Putridiphycobacter roseus TaxID=2219161 RepID=A0A2W1NFK6_9FLAO|nr:hypothetical protein [Putridiphycobacter roseus]PZE18265.1 hypothetical protein DNU06_00065 [Putridiphycobacter roseus]
MNSVLKPRIGIGTGTVAYFGEIQQYQSGFSSTVNRMGGNVTLNAPLTQAFNLEFLAVYGKVSANERTLTRNLNFESRVRMASVSLQYNFYPFFDPTRSFFNPYVGIGFSTFEFLSKTDLYDANGQKYYYWTDGSIMNLAQNDPGANNAKPLIRDYTYETDLREQNIDSLGKYKEQSFAIPISFGVEFHMTPRVDFRIGATLNYTFTDLLDNISVAGSGERKGDARNDFILYSNIGISYDLEKLKKEDEDEFLTEEELLALYDRTDWDSDGVIDALDDCFATPLEALVNEFGCPLDTDEDGVPDYFDEEVTPKGNYVNQYGVTITEAEFLRIQQLLIDSTGLAYGFEEDFLRVDFKNDKGQIVKTKGRGEDGNKSYVVIVGKEHKSISANDLHQYLGYTDFETVTKGDTVYYVLGKYEFIEDAVAAKTSLENQGVVVDEIGKETRNNSDFKAINTEVVDKIEKINIAAGKPLPEYNESKPSFRVKLGTFDTPINADSIYRGIENITFAKGQDGKVRYYAGVYDSYKDAKTLSRTLVEKKGIVENEVVAYQDQKRISLKEAGVLFLPNSYDESKEIASFVEPRPLDTIPKRDKPKIDPASINYQILLGSFENEIPIDVIQKFLSIGGVQPIKEKDGTTKYYSKKVNTLKEAEDLLKEYQGYQLTDPSIKVLYKGKYLTLEEFEKKQ